MTELRDALEASFKEDEEQDLQEDQAAPQGDDVVNDDDEGAINDTGTTVSEKEEVEEKAEAPAAEERQEIPAKQDETPPSLKAKAPASWSPKAREKWATLPPEAQAEVAKREKEINKVMQDSAGARQAVQQLNTVLTPYRDGLIAAGASDPFQAIDVLLKTEATLRAGPAQSKAQTVANMIKQYGVDIGMLDSMLTGEPLQDNPTSQIEQLLDQRLAPVQQFLQQQQYSQQQAVMHEQQSAAQTVEQFSQGAEFIEDVRNDMADLMDMAAARGQQMTIEQAYEKACAINPEVSAIMSERAKKSAIMNTNAATTQKRRAAASLVGRQGGPGGGRQSQSLRDTIADLWPDS